MFTWLRCALSIALAVGPLGVLFCAPVCSTWVWMNRSTSCRSLHSPCGREGLECVRLANQQVARVCLLALLMCITGRAFILEQPGSSLLFAHPSFQSLCRICGIHSVRFFMGWYKAPSPKPTILYSNSANLLQGFRAGGMPKTTKQLVKKYRDSAGRLRVVGKTALKFSQVYPKAFGQKIAKNLRAYQKLRRAQNSEPLAPAIISVQTTFISCNIKAKTF
jgi:hypothetical protein